MKLETWKNLPTWLKKTTLTDAYNMTEQQAITKLKTWGDWKEEDSTLK